MNLLIQSGNLKLNKQGNYGDNLVVTNKQGNKSKKQRYTTPFTYNNLMRLKEIEKNKQKLNLDKVKFNQRYLFSSSISSSSVS